MIEIAYADGKKVLLAKSDIKKVKEYYDGRYPSINSTIELKNGNFIESCMQYSDIKKMVEQSNSVGAVVKQGISSADVCEWVKEDGYYKTQCRCSHEIPDNDYSHEHFVYCPYCGNRIKDSSNEQTV